MQQPQDFEDLLERFEEAWKRGDPPRLEQFLPATNGNAAARHLCLVELIKIDLEYRWQFKQRLRPLRLEDYAGRFPELGPLERLPLDLLGEEYRIRKYWNDCPTHEEYCQRFPLYKDLLPKSLQRIDAVLSREGAGSRGPSPVIAPNPGSVSPARQLPALGSSEELMAALGSQALLVPSQLDQLARELPGRFAKPQELAKELVLRNWITPLQANYLMSGRGPELTLGPYLLLERLGEGGTGQVFKARHLKMDRVVALKLIRKDMLTDDEVVARFIREIQVVSQFSDPHVVHALDAGPIGANYVLAMEFVEGTDLNRLVRKSGPLPVAQACEYIRQAAEGLQHVHERGLVHRDIKPPNLLLARGKDAGARDTVKILDLGLARLRKPNAAGGTEDNNTNFLTPAGAMMIGTPDYLAPEQALDFHRADIRADIYGLGCTLYFLLTGKAPFPGGTLAQKLLAHQQAEPPPVEQFRADMPRALVPVLRKMMAKRPADRYQTPGEVARALASMFPPGASSTAFQTSPSHPVALVASGLTPSIPAPGPASPLAPSIGASWRTRLTFWLGRLAALRSRRLMVAACGLLVLSGVLWLALRLVTGPPSPSPNSSSLDRWERSKIPFELRKDLPEEVVAIIGAPGLPAWRHDIDTAFGDVSDVSADGKVAGCATSASEFTAWDTASGTVKRTLVEKDGIISAAFSGDGKLLAMGIPLVPGKEGQVRVWEMDKENKPIPTAIIFPYSLAFSADGRTLACHSISSIRLWELPANKELWWLFDTKVDSSSRIKFSPDRRFLAVPGIDDKMRLYSIYPKGDAPTIFPVSCASVAISPDGKRLATGGKEGTIKLWDNSGKESMSWQGHDKGQRVRSVAFAPDGQMLASVGKHRVKLWDGKVDKPLKSWPLEDITSAYFAPDNRHLFLHHYDGFFYLLRLKR